MQIAALAHDIDRGVTGITEKDCKDYSKIKEFKKEHAFRSAEIIGELLKKHNYNSSLIAKVKYLVAAHEEGGDSEQTILMEADSLAYFEYNIPGCLQRYGRERTIKKILFMYNRLNKSTQKLVPKIKYDDLEIRQLVKEAVSKK